MSLRFAGTVSPDSVTYTGIDGRNIVVSKSHPNNLKIREEIKEMQKLLKNADCKSKDFNQALIETCWQRLTDLADIPAYVAKRSQGLVQVKDGVVYYGDEALHNSVTRRILWGLSEGYDMDSYINFLGKLMENPSKRAVDELFDFLEACNMGITEDGDFLAYKNVRANYFDIHSGKFDNSVGQILEMARNKVDEDKNRTCSTGFHFASQAYLPHFYSAGGHTMIVKINPRDVVAIPSDYQNAKGRACRYEIVAEYKGPEGKDPLAALPVWTDKAIQSRFQDTWSDDESYDADLDYWDEDENELEEELDALQETFDSLATDESCDYCGCDADCDFCCCDGDCDDYEARQQKADAAPVFPDVSHDRKDVTVSALPEGGVKATFDFADNGIKYNFDLAIDKTGTPALVVHEFHPRIVKHDEIIETEGKTSTEMDRNAVINILRGGPGQKVQEFKTPAQALAEFEALKAAKNPLADLKPVALNDRQALIAAVKTEKATSSFIRSVEYDNGILLVTFANGSMAEYYRVSRSVGEAFRDAESKGRFFNENIRDQYEWNYI
jgi:hypothetical protein